MHHDILFQVFLFAVYYGVGHWLFFGGKSKAKATASTTTQAATPKALTATATPAATTPETTTQPATIATAPKAIASVNSATATATPAANLKSTAQPIQTTLTPATAPQPGKSKRQGSRTFTAEAQSPVQTENKLPTLLEVVPDPIATAEGEGGFGKLKTTKGNPKSTTGRTRSRKTIAALSA